jgi:hypothetical protein
MKTKKFIKKVSRYLVLSKEFEQKESDLFEERSVEESLACIDNSGNLINVNYNNFNYGDFIYNHNAISGIIKESYTRSEVILSKAKVEASRSDRYDEYKKLQVSLSEYFEALEQVTKK